MIEAVIISVDLEQARQLGVNFAVVDNLGTVLGTVGSGTELNNNVGFNPTQLLTTGGKIAGAAADPTGFASSANGAKFGFVANNVTGFIQALETIGSTKILASPRILVLNKQRAEIQLGSRLGFQTFSQNFTSTIQQVQFLNTGTLLRIRPFISDDGMIRMEIHPERSSGTVVNNIPNQNTAELTTNVMVPDGATLVIGGLMEDEEDFSLQGLPGLARIPALGYLFGYRQKNTGRRELVVLLTPHIWSPDQVLPHGPAPGTGPQGPPNGGPDQGVAGANDSVTLVTAGSSIANAAAPLPAGTAAIVPPQITLTRSNVVNPSTGAIPPPRPVVGARPVVAPPQSARPVAAAAPAPGEPQDSRPPRRRLFGLRSSRTSGRSDPPNRNQPNSQAAHPGATQYPISVGPTRSKIREPTAQPRRPLSRVRRNDRAPPLRRCWSPSKAQATE